MKSLHVHPAAPRLQRGRTNILEQHGGGRHLVVTRVIAEPVRIFLEKLQDHRPQRARIASLEQGDNRGVGCAAPDLNQAAGFHHAQHRIVRSQRYDVKLDAGG